MILVLFASKSDKAVYDRVVAQLRKDNAEFQLRIASAHKSPDFVEEIIKGNYDCIISGAGLAAHLPGVVAAKVLCPVIGVPVDINFKGLDALLSIFQMPPGIPVLGTGVNEAEEAAITAQKLIKKYTTVRLVPGENKKALQKAIDVLKKFSIEYTESADFDQDAININFSDVRKSDALVITVPSTEHADELLQVKHGVFVGNNRGDNAALAAIQIMNQNAIADYRKELVETIKKADAEEAIK